MGPLRHSEADRRTVQAQLGRPLRGHWAVVRRCHLGIPMVIETHPRLEDGSPFPTLLWLTCPVLTSRASRLEGEGYMALLNDKLAGDTDGRGRMAEAIGRYRARRDARAPIEDSGSPPGGGPGRIKCLHAHLAHELASPPNPAGASALATAGWPDCRASCVGPA
jgi:uncharacterized protein